jgi:hypothetical protein
MTDVIPAPTRSTEDLRAAADRHLWRHFAEIDEARRTPRGRFLSHSDSK